MTGNKNIEAKILYIEGPVECRIVSRLNRFVLQVELDGSYSQAYTNNTGRLPQFLIRGKKGFCISSQRPGRISHRLLAIEEGGRGAIIDTQLQMQAFEKSLEKGLIPWLKGSKILKRNAKLGDSLIDYLLQCDGDKVYLEVKSAVLREDNYAMYPDCPSARGRKHVKELINHVQGGGRAIILFIAALPQVTAFKPNKAADPEMYKLLVEAHQIGVEIKSIGMVFHPEDSFVYLFHPDLDICLS